MLKIVLDAGHGKNYNTGAVAGFYEGNNNYYACLALKAELEKYDGVSVVMTRSALADDPSLSARGKMGNDADLFLSWHSNGFTKESACGVISFYSIHRPNDKALCEKFNKPIVALFGGNTYDRGAATAVHSKDKNRDYYGVIRNSVLTNGDSLGSTPVQSKCKHSIIIEHGFHSNKAECTKLADPAFRDKLVKAEAQVIAEYFGLKLKKATKTVYRVQVGSFTTKANATRFCNQLKEDGYEGFVVKAEV